MKTVLWQGDFSRLNSLALDNLRIIKHLRNYEKKIYIAPTDFLYEIPLQEPPDIYVIHGYPFDYHHAPGRFNVFFFQYEYLDLLKEHRQMVEHVNNSFDLIIVTSEFVKQVCRDSGFRLPIEVCTLGFDPNIFNTSVKPKSLSTDKSFKFLNLGGPIHRKGFDILVQAYSQEFSNTDDVVLIIKSFSYFWLRSWAEEVLEKYHQGRDKAEILYLHRDEQNIAGYYTASDVGVYPYRGEGFGLTILESIACGRPVIVTQGGSTDDFCNGENAHFIPSKVKQSEDQKYLEPDIDSLKQLMREAYERGRLEIKENAAISATVSSLTLENSAQKFNAILENYYPTSKITPIKKQSSEIVPLAKINNEMGLQTSTWERYDQQINRAFESTLGPMKKIGSAAPNFFGRAEIALGKSGESWEHFARLREQEAKTKLVLFIENLQLRDPESSLVMEMALAGLDQVIYPNNNSIMQWYRQRELQVADHFLVMDSLSANKIRQDFGHQHVHKIDPPIDAPKKTRKKKAGDPLVYLFVALEPLRRGARLLFQAWDELAFENAELICLSFDRLIPSTEYFIKHVVRNPNITIYSVEETDDLSEFHHKSDVHVSPALWDGFFQPVADSLSYGNPIITTRKSGVSDILEHKKNSFLINDLSLSSVMEGLAFFYDHQHKLRQFAEESKKTAQQYSIDNFADQIFGVLSSIRKEIDET